jgi:membrane protein YdbS with pleckstrin-like domain
MISIQCDNCDKMFEVADTEAGGKAACPACGDVNRIPPAAPGAVAGSATAAVAAVPAAPASSEVEKEIAVIRPAMFRAHPFKYLLLVLVLVAGAVLVIWSFSIAPEWKWWALAGGAVLLVIAGIWWLKWWVAVNRWLKLTITNKRTIRQEGIVRRHTTEVLHNHVRSVDIQQNFVQRIFNVGTVGIDSAGQDEIEIVVNDLPTPFKVKEIIDKYRRM